MKLAADAAMPSMWTVFSRVEALERVVDRLAFEDVAALGC
jgi:hypothetical protein